MLPNREPLQIKLRETDSGSSVYDAQIKAGGNETFMTFAHNVKDGSPVIDGYWRIDENGVPGYAALDSGDTVSAFYDVYTHFNDKFSTEDGTEHTFGGIPAILYDTLTNGSYYYMIDITDILGAKFQSEVVEFSIKN